MFGRINSGPRCAVQFDVVASKRSSRPSRATGQKDRAGSGRKNVEIATKAWDFVVAVRPLRIVVRQLCGLRTAYVQFL